MGINTPVFDWVKKEIESQLQLVQPSADSAIETVEIPVCYDVALSNDIQNFQLTTGLDAAEIIKIHSKLKYHVYMLGFLPGFAYMGEVDVKIALPRKANPTKVKAGAVAIAGRQTGIYPLDSFGGWNVLGHTPVKMFDTKKQPPCYLKPGQEIKFFSISIKEFHQLKNAK